MIKTGDRTRTLSQWPTREISLPSVKRGRYRLPTDPILRKMRREAIMEERSIRRRSSGRLIVPRRPTPRPVLATLPNWALCCEIWHTRGIEFMPKLIEILGRAPTVAEVIRTGRSSPGARRSYYRMLKERTSLAKLEALLLVSNI